MTIGIYKLEFHSLEGLPYVGQSSNIEERFKQHRYYLKSGKANKWLQLAFELSEKYPVLTILEEAEIVHLNDREIYWINKLNSLNLGLNITDKVDNLGRGENNFNSKYSNYLIEQVFLYCISNIERLSNQQIGDHFNVHKSIVASIIDGKTHTWLSEKYPKEYKNLINRNIIRTNNAQKLGITFKQVLSPKGEVFSVEKLNEFARKHNINPSSLSQLLSGKRLSANKWKLAG